MNTSIITFIKNPKLGTVKTRLAKSVGDEAAMEIYMRLMAHTRDTISGVEEASVYVYYSTFIDEGDDWSNEKFNKKLQHPGDLGDRMNAAFSEVLSKEDKAVIVGSDCAQLAPVHLEEALTKLSEVNVVIGPTYDGGYYLLGMDKLYPELFDDIEWSTEQVYEQTIKKIEALGLTYSTLEKLSDIDYIEDWNRYGLDRLAD